MTCRHCGKPIHYSVPDTVYVHEGGEYYCSPFPTHAVPRAEDLERLEIKRAADEVRRLGRRLP